jgi:predicted  nucleic acid-binding Zn-ribbon protein
MGSQTGLIDARRAERDRLLASLPTPVRKLYDRISARIRDGVALAEARNGSCSACFMSLRPQVMAEIRRGAEIIQCENCWRILYYAPAAQQPQQSTTTTVGAS